MKVKNLTLIAGIVIAASMSHAAKDLELNCSVVAVGQANDRFLEEGLGSIYDISENGYAESDSDSTGASIKIKRNSIALQLGQASWDSSSLKIKTRTFNYSIEYSGQSGMGIEVTFRDTQGTLVWRIFPELNIARINFSGNDDKGSHLATIDCSGVKDIRFR